MTRTRVAAAVVAASVAWSGAARAEDPPKDEASRRAAIAKLGRLAWASGGNPLAFCDLDGGDVVTSGAVEVAFVRWLPDCRRVVAMANRRVVVVDSVTGKTTDLAPDEPDALFGGPRLSPDGHFGASRRMVQRSNSKLPSPVAYTVFDLDLGTHTDVGTLEPDNAVISSGSSTPWWSPKGELYAVVSAPHEAGEPQDVLHRRYRLVRWSPHDRSVAVVAELPPATVVTEMAFAGQRYAYIVSDHPSDRATSVRADDGSTIFEVAKNHQIWGLRWDEEGTALRFGVNHLGEFPPGEQEPRSRLQRVEPGKPAVEVAELAPPPRVPIDGGWIEQRPGDVPRGQDRDHTESELWRVSASGEATKIGLGSAPRRLGDVVIFWRAAAPTKDAHGRYVEIPWPTPGHGDLWAYDPRDGAQIRLTTCGFVADRWDIRPSAAEPTKR